MACELAIRGSINWWLIGAFFVCTAVCPRIGQGDERKEAPEKKYVEVPSKASQAGSNGPKRDGKQIVEVKLWVVEVDAKKLRAIGFDWSALVDASSEKRATLAPEFFIALEQNHLARVIATPTITSQSGRKASLEVSPQLKLDVTPVVKDDGQIELEYRIDVDTSTGNQPEQAARRLVTAYSTELESGATKCLSQTNAQRRSENGKTVETMLVVLARATTLK